MSASAAVRIAACARTRLSALPGARDRATHRQVRLQVLNVRCRRACNLAALDLVPNLGALALWAGARRQVFSQCTRAHARSRLRVPGSACMHVVGGARSVQADTMCERRAMSAPWYQCPRAHPWPRASTLDDGWRRATRMGCFLNGAAASSAPCRRGMTRQSLCWRGKAPEGGEGEGGMRAHAVWSVPRRGCGPQKRASLRVESQSRGRAVRQGRCARIHELGTYEQVKATVRSAQQ